ncbi:putative reverse transcriptase, RNA-dependent DNA polymerase [Tanacetum coccineum]
MSVYEEDIKLLKHEIHLREVAITELRRKLELAQKQKDKIQLTVEKYKNSSKSLSKLIDYHIVDKCKTGLGYNDVPPTYIGHFMSPKPDLSFSGLEEFVNDPIVSKPTVKKPVVETSEAKASADMPKAVRKNNGAPLIKDWVSDTEEEDVPQAKIQKKTVKPSFAKIEFVKSKEQVKSPRKTTVKQGVIDSGCSRHMTRNMPYLTDFEEINGGYVAFGGNPKGGKITGRVRGKDRITNEAAKTMLADSMLPTTFWAEAVNTACYAQNRVLVTKPHNKTPYKLFLGRKPALGFMRPFGYLFKILNTIDHLGKFDGRLMKDSLLGNQSNGNAGTKACDDAGKMETVPGKDYILLPLWPVDPLLSQSSKSSFDDGFKPLGDYEKKITKEPGKEGEVNVVDPKTSIELPNDPNMPELKDIVYSDDDEDVGAEADINNLDTHIPVSPIPTTRIHKDHPVEQIIRDIYSAPQTRRMTKSVTEQAMFKEPKKVIQALKDPSWIEAMQEELLQFKLQQVWTLVDLPNGKRAIGTKWVYRNKKDERGIMIKNKARLVAQGYTQEEGIDYDEVFSPVARIEAIRLFLAYASFKDFVVYQMDIKSAFPYGKIEEEVYVCQPPRFEDPDFPNRVYKVEKALYGLHQAPKACDVKTTSTPMETHKPLLKDADGKDVDEHLYRSMIGSLMYLTSSRPDIIYLKGQPKLGLWYPKDSTFDLVAYNNSNYAGANLDRKSTTGGCQFLGCRLISWKCKKQTVTKIHIDNESTICIVKNPVFHSKTKHTEIRHHFIRDYNEKKLIHMIKIHTDQNVADLLTKAFDVSRFQYLIASIGMLNL